MDDRLATNRAHWDELVDLHPTTDLYDLEAFLAGESSLFPLELEEFGAVLQSTSDSAAREERGDTHPSLLHLQCHFGLDTLSWAREGAAVTGVDFSERAIETACELADETGLDARFIQSDIYDLPDALTEQFDAVFTSYGVIYWLPDLDGWAEIIERFLHPSGTFYMAEIHPFTSSLEWDEPGSCRLAWPYFETGFEVEAEGSYADRDADLEQTTVYEWSHSLSDVLMALIDAGLELEFVHEHPFTTFQQFESMEQDDKGYWRIPELKHDIPLLFSIRARKPA